MEKNSCSKVFKPAPSYKKSLGSSNDENSVCSRDDDDFFWSRQDDPDDLIDEHAENRTNSTLQESDTGDEAEEVDPDTELFDDIVENHDKESNPYVPNMTDMEKAETHERKWIKYNEDKQKMLDEAYVISVVPSRTTKVKVGDEVKWVSYSIAFL